MKYKKIYEVLEQRRSSSPDFRYSDYSGWRSYYRSYMDRQRPLWIVAEDPSAGRRLWITQERSQLSITVTQLEIPSAISIFSFHTHSSRFRKLPIWLGFISIVFGKSDQILTEFSLFPF